MYLSRQAGKFVSFSLPREDGRGGAEAAADRDDVGVLIGDEGPVHVDGGFDSEKMFLVYKE